MAVTGSRGAPAAGNITQGKFSYLRIYLCEASVAAPVTATLLDGVQTWNSGTPDTDVDEKVFHQGGGNEYTRKRYGFTYPFEITFLNGYAFSELEKLYNRTFDSSNDAFIPFDPLRQEYPQFIFEGIVRQDDNNTHLGSVLFPDVIINPLSWNNPLEAGEFTVTGYTRRPVGLMPASAEVVYDQFSGDGSTTEFTLSSTPLTCTTASNYASLDYNNMIYVKEKASGDSTGTLQKSGYSASGVTLTATTAPAAGTTVQVLYINAT